MPASCCRSVDEWDVQWRMASYLFVLVESAFFVPRKVSFFLLAWLTFIERFAMLG